MNMAHKLIRKMIVLCAAGLLLAGCGGGSGNPENRLARTETETAVPPPAEFSQARAKWTAGAISSYRFQLSQSCNCQYEGGAINVIVANGVVTRAYFEDTGVDLSAERTARLPTLDKLFELAEEAFSKDLTVRFTANGEYGYLEHLFIDRIAGASDDELDYTVSGFSL